MARRVMIDGAALTEQWIEPDPWSWCYRISPVPHPHQTPHQRRHGDLLSPGSPDQHVMFMGG